MPVKLKIRKGDRVVVLTGRDKGKQGNVLNVPERKPGGGAGRECGPAPPEANAAQEGGIIAKELPIHISNLAHIDPKDGKPTRIGYKFLSDGKRVRVAKTLGGGDQWLSAMCRG